MAVTKDETRNKTSTVSRKTRRIDLVASQSTMPLVPPPHALRPTADEFATMTFESHFLSGKFSFHSSGGGRSGSNVGEPSIGPIPASALKPDMDPMLHAVVMALGLTSVPVARRDLSIQRLALQKHYQAIKLTNQALANPVTAVRDSTLMTVILLQFYESLTWTDGDNSFKNWTAHVDGAATLLKLRGAEQFKSPIGLAMFTYIRQRVISGCRRRSRAVPPHFMRLGRISRRYMTADELRATDLIDIVTEYCQFRDDVRTKRLVDLDQIVSRLGELDKKLLSWAQNLPSSYRCQRYQAPDIQSVYEGAVNIYTRRWTAAVWNKYRVLRIAICQDLRSYLALANQSGTYDSTSWVKSLQSTIWSMSRDICTSLPFIMAPPRQHAASEGGDAARTFGQSRDPNIGRSSDCLSTVQQVDINAVAWIIYPIAEERYNPPEMRTWVLDTIKKLRIDSGIALRNEWAQITQQYMDGGPDSSARSASNNKSPTPDQSLPGPSFRIHQGSTSVLNEGVPFGVNEGVCWGHHAAGVFDTYDIPIDTANPGLGREAIMHSNIPEFEPNNVGTDSEPPADVEQSLWEDDAVHLPRNSGFSSQLSKVGPQLAYHGAKNFTLLSHDRDSGSLGENSTPDASDQTDGSMLDAQLPNDYMEFESDAPFAFTRLSNAPGVLSFPGEVENQFYSGWNACAQPQLDSLS